VIAGRCWWCGAVADSREHKFKRSDLIREHGPAPYLGGAELSGVGADVSTRMRSNKSSPLKFKPNLCQACNNARSQPFDRAYDRFVSWIFTHEEQVLDSRSIDLQAIFSSDWEEAGLNVLRYFAKHICCRIADLVLEGYSARLPEDLIAFLNGAGPSSMLSCRFYVEPALLRFCEAGVDDPLWNRPLWIGPIYGPAATGGSFISARWHYGWLSLGWALGPDADGAHPFSDPLIPVPFWAEAFTPPIEATFAAMRFRGEEEAHPHALEAPMTPARIEKMQRLWDSPVALWFAAGAVDFEAGTRGRAPDERRNTDVEHPEKVSLQSDLRRVQHLVKSCLGWALGVLTGETRVAMGSLNFGVETAEEIQALVAFLQAGRDDSTPLRELRTDFACLSALALANAYLANLTSEAGQQGIVEAARLAGCCLMAAALAADDPGEGFRTLHRTEQELAAIL
jgi:hypothetical protein